MEIISLDNTASTMILNETNIVSLKFNCGIVKIDRKLLTSRFDYPGFECKDEELNFVDIFPKISKLCLEEFVKHLYNPNLERIKSRELAKMLIYFIPKYRIYLYKENADLCSPNISISFTSYESVVSVIKEFNKIDIDALYRFLPGLSVDLLIENLDSLSHNVKEHILKTRLLCHEYIVEIIKSLQFTKVSKLIFDIDTILMGNSDSSYHFFIKRRKEINNVVDELLSKNHWKREKDEKE